MDDEVAASSEAAQQHDLERFLQQDQDEIAAEYKRIYRRSTEDPGTAGDEGEENWAALLREWLPQSYTTVTKGRIIFPDKTASGHIDVLVLRSGYPPRLFNKKVYLSSGVVAAFECKNTLAAPHVTEATAMASFLKSRTTRRLGTPHDELRKPPVYGLLAHSHSWKGPSSTPIENTDRAIKSGLDGIGHPSQLIDVICVADLAAWTLSHFLECPWFYRDDVRELRLSAGARPDGAVTSMFTRFSEGMFPPEVRVPNPIAILIAELLDRLGWDDPDLRPIADYFRTAGLLGIGTGPSRVFGLDVLSEEVRQRLEHLPPSQGPQFIRVVGLDDDVLSEEARQRLEHLPPSQGPWDPWFIRA